MNNDQLPMSKEILDRPGGRSTYSRRTILRLLFGGTLTATGLAYLAACSGSTPATTASTAVASTGSSAHPATAAPSTSAVPQPSPAASPPSSVATAQATSGAGSATVTRQASPVGSPVAVDGKYPSPAPRVPDAYTKIPPPFKSVDGIPGRGGKFTTFQITYVAPPTPRETNSYWQEFEKRLGAIIDPTIAPAATYTEKLATVTASGAIPDLTVLFSPDQYGSPIQQGAYTDLTPYLSGDELKKYPNLAILPDDLWKNVKIKGKIYGVPRSRYFTSSALLYRRDWAKKLGLELPKNADEFVQFMTAFTRRDPDGDGQQNTWGLGGQVTDPYNLNYLQQMFRAPNEWRKNADGSLTYYIETPEFAQALAFARKLFEAGFYYPQNTTAAVTQAKNDIIAGKYGAYGDGIAGVPALRAQAINVNPGIDIDVLVPPGHDGGQGTTFNTSGFQGFVAIPAKVGKDSERVKELLRIVNWYSAPFGSEENVFSTFGIDGAHYTRTPDGTFKATDKGKAEVAVLENLADGAQVCYYPTKPDDGPYLQGVLKQILASGIDNPVMSAFSPTSLKQTTILNQFLLDRFNGIIVGRASIDTLDSIVREWKSRSGDQIRSEYEQDLK